MKKELVEKMVRAMKFEPGEVILLNFWGKEEELSDLYAIAAAVASVGAFPQLMIHSLTYYGQLFQNVKDAFPQKWYQQFDAADCVIDILCRAPGRIPEGLENPALYGAYLRGLFQCFSGKKKLIQITMPTEENAKDAGIEFNAFLKELPEGADIVAELGIGMNHLFGGKNVCPVHFDFVAVGNVE